MFTAIKSRSFWTKIILAKLVIVYSAAAVLLCDLILDKVSAANTPAEVLTKASIWQEPDYVAMNQRFEAINSPFPKNVIKAIAWFESQWRHYDDYGQLHVSINYKHKPIPANQRVRNGKIGKIWITYDLGLMQINEDMHTLDLKQWDMSRIHTDPEYNLKAGVAVLENKLAYVDELEARPDWPQLVRKYRLAGHSREEIAIKAYNGLQSSWEYVARINTLAQTRPWEQAMLRQMNENSGLKCQVSLQAEKSISLATADLAGSFSSPRHWLEEKVVAACSASRQTSFQP